MNYKENSQAIQLLLVEDNPSDVRLIKEVLKEGKIRNQLSVAIDGEEAILFLKKQGNFQDKPTPDIILLDLHLPKKDGHKVLDEIKSDPVLKHIPVIILTTSSEQQDVKRTYDHHGNCYIPKPVDFNQFMDVIKTIQNFWLTIVKLPHNS